MRLRLLLPNVQNDFLKTFQNYLEDYGYKCIHKFSQFARTMISSENCSIHLIQKIVKKSGFSSILYNKTLRKIKNSKTKNGDRVRFSKYHFIFRKDHRPQFFKVVFEIVAFFPRKPPKYTIEVERDEIILGIFHPKVDEVQIAM